jgi:hypothetical protein
VTATKLRGFRKYEVIKDLAMGAASREELAEKYGVHGTALWQFSRDFASEIEAVRADLLSQVHDETVGLWIADKVKRIAEYQQDVDDINELLAIAYDDRIVRTKHNALKSVAEELGALPTRGEAKTGEQTVIAYTITKPQDLEAS